MRSGKDFPSLLVGLQVDGNLGGVTPHLTSQTEVFFPLLRETLGMADTTLGSCIGVFSILVQ